MPSFITWECDCGRKKEKGECAGCPQQVSVTKRRRESRVPSSSSCLAAPLGSCFVFKGYSSRGCLSFEKLFELIRVTRCYMHLC